MEALEKRLHSKVDDYKNLQKDFQKMVQVRQKLDAQLNENTLVKQELDILDDSATVYKLIGPALIKQPLEDAKETVSKRIEYITGEIDRYEKTIKDMNDKLNKTRDELNVLQQQYQQTQLKSHS